jgi:DNA repair protein RadC
MRIKDLPNSSKPRERFLEKGPGALSDAELLALILRIGTRGENVVEMANRLLSSYSLEGLFDCSIDELRRIKGIGPNKAIELLTIREIGKRYNDSKNPITRITSSKNVFDYFKESLRDEKQENFIVLLLDTKNKIIKDELVTKGVLDAAIVHPREIFKPAIRNSASKIILVHNHPSGDPTPSPEDLDITEKMKKSGEELDIKVLDHVIIGRETYWSWAESN